MEATALNPPDWLDRLVTLLIPPGAREAVIGDLHEYCLTSGQYAKEALRIAPFVIASQMRRNLNLPALLVQSGLLFCGLGSAVALAALPLLLLRDAYQPLTRPSPRDALRGALLMSFSGVMLMLLVPVVLGQGLDPATARRGSGLLALFILGMPLAPLLCGFRACLIIGSDRTHVWAGADLSLAQLSGQRQAFLRRTRRRNLVEGVVLALCGVCWLLLMHGQTPGMALAAIYGIAALFLFTEMTPRIDGQSDFISLRARYGQELARRQQLHRFLWWLWLAPILLALQSRAESGQLTMMQWSVVAMLLCFLVAALNREGEGRTRELVGALSRAHERVR